MAKLTLLVPLDNTGFSRQIAPILGKLFDPSRYTLKLLHIANTAALSSSLASPALVGMDYGFYLYNDPSIAHPIYDEDELGEFRERLKERLQGQLETFQALGFETTATVIFGEPVKDIVEFAETEKVDVIAMASRGRTGFDRFLLGSVAQDVVHRVSVPVLLAHLDEVEVGELE